LKRKVSSSSNSDSDGGKPSNNVSANDTTKSSNQVSATKQNGAQKRQTSPFRRVREEDADPEYLKKLVKTPSTTKLVHVAPGARKPALI